jgi:iron import ATP-binding/permease protein irtA
MGREYRADHFVRVFLHSDTLLAPGGEAPGNWVRAWFPDPDGGAKQFQRGYTLAEADPGTGEFAIDFVIHHPMGPAAYWATTCEPGDQIVAMRLGEEPFELLDPAPRGYLFLGDLASYPAIHALASSIPPEHPVVVYLEQHDERDVELPLPEGPNIEARWVDELPDGQGLAQAISGRDWTGWYAWVTAESLATRRARTPLEREFGLNRATLHAQAYWVKGRAMGKSRILEQAAQQQEPQPVGTATVSPTPERVLAPARGALVVGGLVQALLAVVQVVPFILFAEVARLFLRGAGVSEFIAVGVAALLVMALSAAGTTVLLFGMHLYDARFAAALRQRLMDKLSTLPLGWFTNRKAADVKTLVGDDVAALHYLVTHSVLDLVAAIVTPVATLGYLFAVQWRLALVLLLPLVVFLVVMIRISRRDDDKNALVQRTSALASGQAQTFLSTIDQARVFGPRAVVDLPETLCRMGDVVERWQRETSLAKIQAVMINRPTTVLGLLVLVGWAFISAGWMRPEELIVFLIVGTSCGSQLIGIASGIGILTQSFAARDSLEWLLGTPGLASLENRSAPPGHVRFSGVRFGYGAGPTVLPALDLELRPGQVTALVGPSGAGKSTVAALLARMWDPQAGTISIDGVDIRGLSSDELYAKVAILLQDVQLLRASVRDNIVLSRPEATDEQVRATAEAAQIHERIMQLPQGYATVVDNTRLSGGERQRIGIARTLLADTPIVVLDEATAAADPDSEWAIRQGLDHLLKGRTVLMIAHRLHTVRDADRIVVLREGAIAESGTHQELLDRNGTYAELWRAGSGHEGSR